MPLGTSFKGIDSVRGFYQAIAAALPDLHPPFQNMMCPGCSVREVVISGTHLGVLLE
jgi:hypothetical protein